LTGIGRRSDITGTTGNRGLPAPTARSSTVASSRLLRRTGRTSPTGIARQDPHAPQPRSHADPRLARHDSRPPRHRGHAVIPIVRQDLHVSYTRSHPMILGSFARFPGFVCSVSWVRLLGLGTRDGRAGFVRSRSRRRSPSLPSDRAGAVRGTIRGALTKKGDRPEPDRSAPAKQSTELSRIHHGEPWHTGEQTQAISAFSWEGPV
jgi:hypothetical protein